MISRVRSRPANASVSCVPMFTIWKTGRDHEGEEHVVAEVVADRPGASEHSVTAEPHDERRNEAEHSGGRRRHDAGHGERAHHVLEEPLDAFREDRMFALFGVIALDDANAAERFREAAGDFGVDAAALAEDGADDFESRIAAQVTKAPITAKTVTVTVTLR